MSSKRPADREVKVCVDSNGGISIAARFRKSLRLRSGDVLILRLECDELRIMTFQRRIELSQESVRKYVKPGTSLADELIAERRAEAIREIE